VPQNKIPQQRENRYWVFEIITQSHHLNDENELSGYKLFEKMCAETDQDRRHRLEARRQNDFVIEATRGGKKYTIIKILLPEIYLSNRTVTEQVGSKLFPLSTIIFTLDVPVIIITI